MNSDVTVPSPTPEIAPTPTIQPTESASSTTEQVAADTIVFYTTKPRPDASFPLLAWPELAVVDRPEFQNLYGDDGPGMLINNITPRFNATGNYMVIPGLGGHGPNGIQEPGAGTWVVNLNTGDVQKLWNKRTYTAWSPDGTQLAYVQHNTLYRRTVTDEAEAIELFTTPGLQPLFVDWSPTGDWIAVVSTVEGTSTLYLVSPDGDQVKERGAFPTHPVEHVRRDVQWAPDGSAILLGMVRPNYIVTPDGQQYPLEEGAKALAWIPRHATAPEVPLLVRTQQGVCIANRDGEQLQQVTSRDITAWSFSADGRYLAYTERSEEAPTDIAIFDLQSRETKTIGSVPAKHVSSLHWTPAGTVVIADDGDYQTPVWALGVESHNKAEALVEKGLLLTVIPRPTTPESHR